MTIQTTSVAAVLAALILCPVAASAQCEDSEAAAKTAASVKAEMSELQAAQRKAFMETQVAISKRAIELSWTVEQKNAFLKAVTESPEFVQIDARKQQELMTVEGVQRELNKPEVQEDPVKACTAGVRLVAPMRKIAELTSQQNHLVLERMAAAR